ncbi:MAG: 3-dehydroquinate synthase [Candidatus Gorgyraea atricola]|nr:3-dehydroquinate synthase [Candidatus Gorgyraea atricola]
MKKIRVNLGKRSYDIKVSRNEIADLGKHLKRLKIGTDAVIITNPVIKRLLGKKIQASLSLSGFNVRFSVVPDSEKSKSEKYCISLLNRLSKFDGSSRRMFIVALGGGVIGDLAGFVASIYRRGIPYIQVPTTLLAQVDSAIGGKVAIDLSVGKNLAGAFYQPRLVFSDAALLKTLPKKDLISGLGEVVKYGIIKSPQLFSFLEKNYKKVLGRDKKSLEYIIYTCSLIKARVVEKDEHDNKGIRVILNLGHTIGHAIETAAHYGKSYSHGQAIALGTIAASHIARELGLLDEGSFLRIKNLIKKIGLPVTLKGLDIKAIFKAQEHDKKFIHGKNRFVLPVNIGKTVVKENIPKSVILNSIKSLL